MTDIKETNLDKMMNSGGGGIPDCATCQRYIGKMKCEAYPFGIPPKLRSGARSHRTEYIGDSGLTYQPREKKS